MKPTPPIGPHCPARLPTAGEFETYVVVLHTEFDDENFQCGERINGFDQCPKCELWWPCIEQPDVWEENDSGQWIATGWWGVAFCCECNLLLVMQLDWTPEAYQL